MIGDTLGHYRNLVKLGEGGMGEVYRAEDTKLQRLVAIKVLPEAMASDPERLARFEREARAVAALNHPNIVTIHSVEQVDGIHFLTMELVEGASLEECIPSGGVGLKRFFELALPIADAVAAAHRKGIVHRDLKPANVMLGDGGRIKVLDFGLAKLQEDFGPQRAEGATATLTRDGMALGTVPYMSPEQVEGRPADSRADVFSLGVLLHELLVGMRPFQGETTAGLISSILRDTPPRVTEAKPGLPNHLGRIVDRCLEKNPEHRYSNATEVHNELKRLKAEIASGAGAAAAPAPAGKPPKALWMGVALVVVLALAAAAVWRSFGRSEPRAPTVARNAAETSLAVLGFENLSDPGDQEQLSRMLMGLVTTDLAEAGGVPVASTARVLTARQQAGLGERSGFDTALAQEAGRHAGVALMLTGQVMRRENGLVVTGELVDVASGKLVSPLRVEEPGGDMFTLASKLASGVRERLAPAGVVQDDFDLARGLTTSTDAYRQYVAGQIALHERRFREAVERFTLAIEHDPTFALAYYRLAIAQDWADGSGNRERQELLVAGLPHINRLPERWRNLYKAYLEYEENPDLAWAAMSDLVASSPDLPDALNVLAEISTHSSRYWDPRRARDLFERAVEIDPTFRLVFQHLIHDYVITDDLEAARRLIRRFAAEAPDDPAVAEAELHLLMAQARYDEVVRLVDRGDEEGYWQLYRSAALLRMGRRDEALSVLEREIQKSAGTRLAVHLAVRATGRFERGRFHDGLKDLERAFEAGDPWDMRRLAGFHLTRARMLETIGEPEAAIAAARAAVEVDPFGAEARYWHGALLWRAGRAGEAERVLKAFHADLDEWESPGAEFWLELLEVEASLASNDPSEAADRVGRLARFPMGHRDPLVGGLVEARVRERNGEIDGALAMYEELLAPPFLVYDLGVSRTSLAEWPLVQIPSLYHLARLLDETGDGAGAARRYREFLDHWEEARRPLPWVAEARERLAALGSRAGAAGARVRVAGSPETG